MFLRQVGLALRRVAALPARCPIVSLFAAAHGRPALWPPAASDIPTSCTQFNAGQRAFVALLPSYADERKRRRPRSVAPPIPPEAVGLLHQDHGPRTDFTPPECRYLAKGIFLWVI